MKSIGIITSNSLRHNYFINSLNKNFKVEFIIREPKVFNPAESFSNESEKEILKNFFILRDNSESTFFNNYSINDIDKRLILNIDAGALNDPHVFEYIKNKKITCIAVFGSSLLKEHFFNLPNISYINMHLGLSPYYRGSGTNFYPFVRNELACVGTTIHKLTLKIDGGEIYHQVRPNIEIFDSIHDIGNRSIISGTNKMIQTINEFFNNKLISHSVDLSIGNLYKRQDFNSSLVLKALENMNNGIVKEYLLNQDYYNKKHPIIE